MSLSSLARPALDNWSMTAVVVDDDNFVLEVMTSRLNRMNIGVVPFGTVKSAVEYIYSNRVAFAIIDLGLPDGDGSEIIDAARASVLNHDIPIIVVTANCSDTVITKFLHRKKAIFVSQKPIDWACLEFVLQGTVVEA